MVNQPIALPEIVSGDYIEDEYEFEYQQSSRKTSSAVDYEESKATEEKSKIQIDPLPPVDHSQINYPAFTRCFYQEPADIMNMSEADVHSYRSEIEVSVTPTSAPRPIQHFTQAGFTTSLLNEITKNGYEKPTAIQAQGLPIALSGFDMIGLAKTGSGKTLAYVWPLLMHIVAQPQMNKG